MIIIGIDPGTYLTGYGLIRVEGKHYRALDYGCIRPPRSQQLAERSLIILDSFSALLEQFKPEALSIETQYFKENFQSAVKLATLRGMLLAAAALRRIPYFEYAPSRVKRAIGNGSASKHQVQRSVQTFLDLKQLPKPDDADALALAICHAHTLKF